VTREQQVRVLNLPVVLSSSPFGVPPPSLDHVTCILCVCRWRLS